MVIIHEHYLIMINHISQPNRFTCGVTCVSMLSGIDVDQYTKQFKINDTTGSTSDKMTAMLKSAGLTFQPVRTEELDSVRDYILKTIKTHYIIQMIFAPIPHWVIITDVDVDNDFEFCSGDDYVIVYDPSEYYNSISMNQVEAYLGYVPYLDMDHKEFDTLGYYKMFIVEK